MKQSITRSQRNKNGGSSVSHWPKPITIVNIYKNTYVKEVGAFISYFIYLLPGTTQFNIARARKKPYTNV